MSDSSKHDSSTDVRNAELPKLDSTDLENILKEHEEWLDSKGQRGSRARIVRRDLRDADPERRLLAKAQLQGAILTGSDFRGMNMEGIDLGVGNGKQTILSGAQLDDCNLKDTVLSKAILTRARMEGATLEEANLKGTNLQDANLKGANLNHAILKKANCGRVILKAATVDGVDLEGAELRGADLSRVDFRNAYGLVGSQLAATNIAQARLPQNISEMRGVSQVMTMSNDARALFMYLLLVIAFSLLTIATTKDWYFYGETAQAPLPVIQTKVPYFWFYFLAPILLLVIHMYLHFNLEGVWTRVNKLPHYFRDGQSIHDRPFPWLVGSLIGNYVRVSGREPDFSLRVMSGISAVLLWALVPVTIIYFWWGYLKGQNLVVSSWHVLLIAVSIGFSWYSFRFAGRLLLQPTLSPKMVAEKAWRGATAIGVLIFVTVLLGSFFAIQKDPLKQKAVLALKKIRFLRTVDSTSFNCLYEIATPDLSRADLPGAKFEGQDLTDLIMSGGNFKRANFSKTQLSGANLDWAELEGARFGSAEMGGVTLRWARMKGAHLEGADLSSADLTGAKLMGANLKAADLRNATLEGAILTGANLDRAKLQHANLGRASLPKADLQGAQLYGTRLDGANFTDVVNLTSEQLEGACGENVKGLDAYGSLENCLRVREETMDSSL